ncbi:MAG: type IX secretion system sortase PorU [Bacteroidota bacterium]|nr:type IX secretion system sortase PorU [Bacteroidota bacterium]
MKFHYIFLYTLVWFFLTINAFSQSASVLSTGDWYKISVVQDGVHKISYADLQQLGVNTSNLSISSIGLFGNGGGMLPKLNSDFRYNDIQENAIQIIDENGNGLFENGDYILFFGQSPDRWQWNESTQLFQFDKHLYSSKTYYFLTTSMSSSPKRIAQKPIESTYSYTTSTFNNYKVHENENINLIGSGSIWYGEVFEIEKSHSIPFNFYNPDFNSLAYISCSVAARSLNPSTFTININGQILQQINISNIVNTYATAYAKTGFGSTSFSLPSSNFDIDINHNTTTNNSTGWLDYIEINLRSHLSMHNNHILFRDINTTSFLSSKFSISAADNLIIWDVTDPINVESIHAEFSNNQVTFIDETSTLKEYVAFYPNYYVTPTMEGSIVNQNLHASSNIEYVIISHPSFLDAANRLAEIYTQGAYKQFDWLTSVVVTTDQIYNEFSSGSQDISAIRDFLRMLHKEDDSVLKYVLLFGDGSYDPKDRIQNNTNYIPTFQSLNSTNPTITYVTDDFFALLDDDEGLFHDDLVDIGIGRMPVQSLTEAHQMVDKIEAYYSSDSFGDWRNVITFIADDGDANDGNVHMWQADSLANIVDAKYNSINIKKLYLDNFEQISTPGGPRSPAMQTAINRQIKKGSLLINYTGHGGELGWTQERILEVDQINQWDNINRLPLFMTATCKFSRFDDPEKTSAGEKVLLNPEGGAIALLTTTRLVYSSPNYNLNTKFINTLFNEGSTTAYRLGDIFKQTKRFSGTSVNNRNFTLLGDPALKLANPYYRIHTTNIKDTIRALEEVFVQGIITDTAGNIVSDFNGTVFPSVFDNEIIATTLGQESSTPMPYKSQENVIYKGAATVSNGVFSFSFIIPKDILYDYANGRISYYAVSDDELFDASGYNEDFIIGGVSLAAVYDNEDPEISLFMNNTNFVSGGITDENPSLLAFVSDFSGINTVGNGIGHDITAILDYESSNPIILNDYYVADRDNYQNGTITFPFEDLQLGEHTLTVKIWDVFNNSAESTISFKVVDDDDITISNFLNYPNPFHNSTDFYFEVNKPDEVLDISLNIYSISGVLISTVSTNIVNTGYRVGPFHWNGENRFGERIESGLYIANLNIKFKSGDFISKSNRVIILPK